MTMDIHKRTVQAVSWAVVLWLSSIITVSAAALGETFSVRKIGPVFNYNTECLAPLLDADTDNDSVLSREEYIALVQFYSSDPIFQVQSFADLPIPLVLEFTRWTCNGYCNFFDPVGSNVDVSDCLNDCKDGIPLIPPQNFGPLDLKPYLYSVCASTFDEVKVLSNVTDDENDDVIISPDKREVPILFGMANLKNLNASDIAQNIDGSLNQVVLPALQGLFRLVKDNLYVERLGGRRLRGTLLKRHLQLTSDDSWVKTIDNRACPGSIRSAYPGAVCQHLTGIFAIDAQGENVDAMALQVSTQAQRYIRDGDFQNQLPENARRDYIFYSLETTPGNSFPLYAIVGVAAGAVLIGLFAGRALIVNRRRRGSQVPDDDLDSDEAEFRNAANVIDDNGAVIEKGQSMAVGTYENADRMSVDGSESDMGSSGWSSSAGLSSLNTGASVDSTEILVSSLAAIGAASRVHKKYSKDSTNDDVYPIPGQEESSQSDSSDFQSLSDDVVMTPGHQQRLAVTRKDLEQQIEKGDWAAVGATAAILASESRSSAGSISSGLGSEFSGSSSAMSSTLSGTSRDRARAAELDRLVEAGDWEGVVLTAAKFEAESDKDDKTEGSASGKNSFKSAADRSFANLSANSPSVSTNVSDSLKRAEIRAEVEALVHRVVPDEIDNVDEMMTQFKGREEELLETLRTMQERSIAARQREVNRRNAKREAKKLAKEAKKASNAGLPPRSTPSKSLKGTAETQSLMNNVSGSDVKSEVSKEESNTSENTPHRKALDEAIAAGDWEAVGRTAEQLGDLADSSVNTSDFESAASENELDISAYLSTDSRTYSDRASELDELIERRDWTGVVAAASRFSLADAKEKITPRKSTENHVDNKSTGSTGSSNKLAFIDSRNTESESDVPVKENERNRNLSKEEKEARAQAEIWSTIAEQSKAKGSNAIGASDAADWAISRSLKQLMDSTPSSKQVETQSVGSSSDDRSV
mmetsp:Transcript_3447/g.6508  ORF Transcript_3447/g.6508 Transcript_3447/m.6508 type:complete len:982 (-) Transcript_3447:711-3656(-)